MLDTTSFTDVTQNDPPERHITGRWVRICQECFEQHAPGLYWPDIINWGTCRFCQQDLLVANVNPNDLNPEGA